MKKLTLGLIAISAICTLLSLKVMAAGIGDNAPDFEAQSTKGNITLSDYAGKNVVLAFFFAAFTPV